jgi:CopG family nickel-responsive transcriptional regulator
MSELVRFGVAMDRALLERFDRRIAARGYENRSEALRDLVRAELARVTQEGGGPVVGTITLSCARRQRHELVRLVESLCAVQLLSTQSVPLDDQHALEVLVVRAQAAELTELTGRLGGVRGVLGSQLSIAAFEATESARDRSDEGGRTR